MTTLTPLSESQARLLTDRIRTGAEQVWGLLQQAHKGRAWEVLGYDSWRTYATTEFGMGQSYAYRLLEAANVSAQLTDAVSPMGENVDLRISERQARDIAPEVDAIAETVRQATAGKIDPEAIKDEVHHIIEDYRAHQAARRHKPPEPNPARDITRACETLAGLTLDNPGDLRLDWSLVVRAKLVLEGVLEARQRATAGV